ncbi:DUF4221 domain-containing protein [Chitinophaga oryziterrae]|uniref:DUF4221 domain-containing protein n=1 Tax=Chitinophaga oryziterrae TaxID=1031224 RepID=A0A6N8J525_9BACT|nr:DUF4221 family protein [Chitinophaga oryziterrae]MVT40280.1 DUF4221 domain-containing protein [Chitinophaga oryziterrae]
MCYRSCKARAALALLVVCLSCHDPLFKVVPTPRNHIGTWHLVGSDTLSIAIDQHSRSTTYMLNDFFKLGDSSFLAVVHQQMNTLNIYNLTSKKLSKRIVFSKDGPNGIGSLFVAHFINYDSILVRGKDDHKLYLMDSAGLVKRTLDLRFEGMDRIRELYFTPNGKPLLMGSRLFGVLLPSVSVDENRHRLTDLPFYTYDLLGNAGRKLVRAVQFPKFFRQDGTRWACISWEPTFCDFKGKIAYGFPALDSIYVYDLNTQKVVAHGVPSVEGFVPVEASTAEWHDGMTVKLAKSAYLNYLLRYDPYQDVFYRFVFLPLEEDLNYTDFYRAMADKPVVVQIIDAKDFSVKGETRLKSKQFYFQDTFVGDDGLYISNNHPARKDRNEDFISYTHFKISK